MDLGYNSQPWCRFLGNLLRHFLRVDLLLVLTFWFHRYMLLSILILRAMTTKHKKLEGIYKITKIGIQIDKTLRHVLYNALDTINTYLDRNSMSKFQF